MIFTLGGKVVLIYFEIFIVIIIRSRLSSWVRGVY